ncbi:PAS domain-containing protein, partial [Streptomyces sp. GC420]|nr:PAS domain-containing protein [Streptomyces sp. GC420]
MVDRVPGQPDPRGVAAGRVPLAVVVVDGDGLVSHWSTGARRLFGRPKEEAVGRPADDLMPIGGALSEPPGQDPRGDHGMHGMHGMHGLYETPGPAFDTALHGRSSYPASGRARLSAPAHGPALS